MRVAPLRSVGGHRRFSFWSVFLLEPSGLHAARDVALEGDGRLATLQTVER